MQDRKKDFFTGESPSLNNEIKRERQLKNLTMYKHIKRLNTSRLKCQKGFDIAYNELEKFNRLYQREISKCKYRETIEAARKKEASIKKDRSEKYVMKLQSCFDEQNKTLKNTFASSAEKVIKTVNYRTVIDARRVVNRNRNNQRALKSAQTLQLLLKITNEALIREKKNAKNLKQQIQNKKANLNHLKTEINRAKAESISKDKLEEQLKDNITRLKKNLTNLTVSYKTQSKEKEAKISDLLSEIYKTQHENTSMLQRLKKKFKTKNKQTLSSCVQTDLTASSVRTVEELDEIEKKYAELLKYQKTLHIQQNLQYLNKNFKPKSPDENKKQENCDLKEKCIKRHSNNVEKRNLQCHTKNETLPLEKQNESQKDNFEEPHPKFLGAPLKNIEQNYHTHQKQEKIKLSETNQTNYLDEERNIKKQKVDKFVVDEIVKEVQVTKRSSPIQSNHSSIAHGLTNEQMTRFRLNQVLSATETLLDIPSLPLESFEQTLSQDLSPDKRYTENILQTISKQNVKKESETCFTAPVMPTSVSSSNVDTSSSTENTSSFSSTYSKSDATSSGYVEPELKKNSITCMNSSTNSDYKASVSATSVTQTKTEPKTKISEIKKPITTTTTTTTTEIIKTATDITTKQSKTKNSISAYKYNGTKTEILTKQSEIKDLPITTKYNKSKRESLTSLSETEDSTTEFDKTKTEALTKQSEIEDLISTDKYNKSERESLTSLSETEDSTTEFDRTETEALTEQSETEDSTSVSECSKTETETTTTNDAITTQTQTRSTMYAQSEETYGTTATTTTGTEETEESCTEYELTTSETSSEKLVKRFQNLPKSADKVNLQQILPAKTNKIEKTYDFPRNENSDSIEQDENSSYNSAKSDLVINNGGKNRVSKTKSNHNNDLRNKIVPLNIHQNKQSNVNSVVQSSYNYPLYSGHRTLKNYFQGYPQQSYYSQYNHYPNNQYVMGSNTNETNLSRYNYSQQIQPASMTYFPSQSWAGMPSSTYQTSYFGYYSPHFYQQQSYYNAAPQARERTTYAPYSSNANQSNYYYYHQN